MSSGTERHRAGAADAIAGAGHENRPGEALW